MAGAYHDALLNRLSSIDQIGVGATDALRQRLAARAAAVSEPSFGMDAGYSSAPSYSGNGQNNFENFRRAISAQESGGRYNAIGVPVRGDRAYGKYQIMGNNIPSWTRSALGRSYTPQQFLRDPNAQERTASYFLQNYYNRYGPAGAAVAWYAGEGNARKYVASNGRGWNRSQTGGPSISSYALSILKRMGLA